MIEKISKLRSESDNNGSVQKDLNRIRLKTGRGQTTGSVSKIFMLLISMLHIVASQTSP
jgi:hypothetical protein